MNIPNEQCAIHSEKIDRIEKNCDKIFDKVDIVVEQLGEIKVMIEGMKGKIQNNSMAIKIVIGTIVGGSGIAGILKALL